jgi:enediyne biosynthesis protein E3
MPGAVRVRRPRVERAAARFIRIDPAQTRLETRGFASCPPDVRSELELHGSSFVRGFNDAMAAGAGAGLTVSLEAVELAERGFAYEGAGMGLALLDVLLPGRARRIEALLAGACGDRHVYMIHVGAGWALARLRRRPWGGLRLDPLLRWLALDGYGFHEAFFSPRPVVREHLRPPRLRGSERNVFDQGVGRALWFVCAADPDGIASKVGAFEPARRADLWSGVGLAATYAGAASDAVLSRLAILAAGYGAELAQGAAFAAKARLRAQNVVPHVERACETFWRAPVDEVASVTDRTLASIGAGDTVEHFERWREAIRVEFASS